MPILSTTRNYKDITSLTQAQLDAAFSSIETFINTTKLDSANIQSGAITSNQLAANSVTQSAISSASVYIAALAAEVTAKLIPTGLVSGFGGTTAPSGWFMCDGTSLSTSTYSTLFSVIGYAHGGSGATFNLPDYRGRFLRGVDGTAGNDPDHASRTAMSLGGNTGNAIGSIQAGATKLPNTPFTTDNPGDHAHSIPYQSGVTGGAGGGVSIAQDSVAGNANHTSNNAGNHAHTITAGGDLETRPLNAYVNYIIKA